METAARNEVLAVLESLFLDRAFVSLAEMEQAAGVSRSEIIELKPELQDRLRSGDPTISLTPVMHQTIEGFFLDVG